MHTPPAPNSRLRRRPRISTVATVAGLLAAGFSGSAVAVPTLSPTASIQDDRLSVNQGIDPALRVAELKKLGARQVRVELRWDLVALKRPLKPADPADPAYYWGWYDRVVKAANDAGIPILFGVYGTPDWAADPTVSKGSKFDKAGIRPQNAEDFGAFGEAAAKRYSPLGVRLWEAWNEPNIPLFLRPQYQLVGGRWQNVSAKTYSDLATAFYRRVKAVDPGATIGGLVTAPAGDKCPPACGAGEEGRTPPVTFINLLNAPGLQPPMDVVSHHPYPLTKPRTFTVPTVGYVDIYNLDFLTRALDKTYLKGKGLWLTEFGFATEPTENLKNYFSTTQQAAFLQSAYGIIRKNPRVLNLTWYFLQDNPNWKSGLLSQDGVPKPAAAAFALPFTVTNPVVRRGRASQLIGQVRQAVGQTSVTLDLKVKGSYLPLRTVQTSTDGSFAIGVRPRATTTYRVRWTSPTGEVSASTPASIAVIKPKPKLKKKTKR